MKKYLQISFITALLVLLPSTVVSAQSKSTGVGVSSALLAPKVIASYYHKPPRRIKKTIPFRSWESPNRQQIELIMDYEQGIWGGPSLSSRINCESKFNPQATNGQYRGLLQIGSWWESVYPSQTPRKIQLVVKKKIKRPVYKFIVTSDLKIQRKLIRYRAMNIILTYKGKLPADASPYHGWAAIRVGQRAISGAGPGTSWSC